MTSAPITLLSKPGTLVHEVESELRENPTITYALLTAMFPGRSDSSLRAAVCKARSWIDHGVSYTRHRAERLRAARLLRLSHVTQEPRPHTDEVSLPDITQEPRDHLSLVPDPQMISNGLNTEIRRLNTLGVGQTRIAALLQVSYRKVEFAINQINAPAPTLGAGRPTQGAAVA